MNDKSFTFRANKKDLVNLKRLSKIMHRKQSDAIRTLIEYVLSAYDENDTVSEKEIFREVARKIKK